MKILNPLSITTLFFVGSAVFTVLSLYNNKCINNLLKDNWRSILLLLVINFIFKLPLNLHFFDGLEYEDSYVYKVAARFIFENKDYLGVIERSYLTNSCIFGSLRNCYLSATYSGHLIGYPCIIRLAYSIFGYQYDIANMLSLVFSSLSLFFVFTISKLIIDNKLYALICSFVYITVPIFNVFASTSLSELTSNFYISLLLLSYLCYVYYSNVGSNDRFYMAIVNSLSLLFTMGFVVLIKRENISMLICLPLLSVVHLCLNRKTVNAEIIKKKLVEISPIVILIILFYFYVINIMETVQVENLEIGQRAFSISYLVSLAPIFIKGFFKWEWYLFFSFFLFVGYFVADRKSYFVFPLIIFLFYFVLYTTHHRSYYFIKTGEASSFEGIRYMMGIMVLYSLITGMGIYRLGNYILKRFYERRAKTIRAFSYILIMTIATLSLFSTYSLRAYFLEDEYVSRIRPVKTVLESAQTDKPVFITSKPLLFQIYGQTDLEIIDYCSITRSIPTDHIDNLLRNKRNVFYLQDDADFCPINRKRYLPQYNYLNSKKRILVYKGSNFNIYKIMISQQQSQLISTLILG